MPDGKPELEIKISMNGAEALAELRKLDGQMKAAGKSGAASMGQINRPMTRMQGEALSLVRHFGEMISALGALKVGEQVFESMFEGAKRASDEMARMSKEYSDFRAQVASAAGTQGKAPTNAFTAQQIKLADEAQVSPQAFAKTQEAMGEQIAGNIGEGKQLTQGQADNITQKMAQLGEARGISPEALATLTGGIVRGVKGGPDADKEVLNRIGKLVDLMDKSPGKIEKLLPELNEVLATGAGYEEAGQLVSVHAARGRPGEAGTYARATQRAIARHAQDVESGDREDDLGITGDMNDVQASESIYKRIKEDGVDLSKVRDVRGWLAEKGFKAAEEQDALMSMFNNGVEGGGIQNARDTIAAGGVGAVDKSIDLERGTEKGQLRIARGKTESAELTRGAKESRLELEREKAKGQLTAEGEFDSNTWGDTFRDWLPDSMFGDLKTSKINSRVNRNLNRELVDTVEKKGSGGYDSLQLGSMQGSDLPTIGAARSEAMGLIDLLKELNKTTSIVAQNTRPTTPPVNPPNPATRTN